MFNFPIKRKEVDDEIIPIRSLRYKETAFRPRAFAIYVGQVFPLDRNNKVTVTSIEYRKDYYDSTGDMLYDVYVEDADGLETRWKRLPHESNLDVEYKINF